ncbi:MAG: hypothetical protein NXI31_21895 [bacterium]|nr:hypothetical protein [bacterium]
MTRNRFSSACLLAIVLSAGDRGLSAQAEAPRSPLDAASELARILGSGRWHDGAERAYGRLALARAKEVCGSRVAKDFWGWLDDRARLRRRVVWASAVAPEPAFYVRLDSLRRAHPRAVDALPDLAVGFALAWSSGTDEVPALAWEPWTFGRSAIPGMAASFAWYAEHRRDLAARVEHTNWQLLAFTALNDVPFDERAWALERYRGKPVRELRHLFSEVPYVHEGLDAHPHTLANMIEHGGVCTVNTQYQMAVLRTLGCPATYGGGPGHVWPCWLTGMGRNAAFDRVNDLGNADGVLGQWGLTGLRYESDLRVLTRAMRHGMSQLEAAELCAAAVTMLGGRAPAGSFKALSATLRRNPYAQRAWRTLMTGIANQRVPQKLASSSLRVLVRALEEHPRVAVRVLEDALPRGLGGQYHREIAEAFVAACDGCIRAADGAAEPVRAARRLAIRYHEGIGNQEIAARLRLELLRDEAAAPADGGPNGLTRTTLAGGGGGSEFVDAIEPADLAAGNRTLRGLRYTTAHYSGHLVIGSVQALYSDGSEGQTFGQVRGGPREVVVPAGHRLLGVEVVSGNLLDGFRLVTCLAEPGRRDPKGQPVFGDWAGGSGKGFGRWLEIPGAPVIGIHGRSGSMIDAFGLIARTSGR